MGKTNTNWKAVGMFKDRTNKINAKEHFRLKKYEVTIKEVARVRFGSHCKYNINYHFVWIPKTRMKILVEPFKYEVDLQIQETTKKYGWHALALEIMPDHIHFFISAHPKWAPSKIIQLIKQESSRKLRDKYSIIRDTRILDKGTEFEKDTKDFWATGYYCGTAGHVSADQVARYIMEQEKKLKKDWKLYDIKPFEYDINEERKPDVHQGTLDAFGIGRFSVLHSV